MLAALITLTPGCRNEFIDCQKAKVQIPLLPIVHGKTQWNLTLELLAQAYQLQEFTFQWLQNPEHSDYWPLFPTQNEWIIIQYVMDVSRPFRYRTL
jgi:acyl-ACP thioesterase